MAFMKLKVLSKKEIAGLSADNPDLLLIEREKIKIFEIPPAPPLKKAINRDISLETNFYACREMRVIR